MGLLSPALRMPGPGNLLRYSSMVRRLPPGPVREEQSKEYRPASNVTPRDISEVPGDLCQQCQKLLSASPPHLCTWTGSGRGSGVRRADAERPTPSAEPARLAPITANPRAPQEVTGAVRRRVPESRVSPVWTKGIFGQEKKSYREILLNKMAVFTLFKQKLFPAFLVSQL